MGQTRGLALLGFVMLLAACEPTTAPTTTVDPVLPPPDPIASTSTTTTALPEVRTGTYEGWLPDGTLYLVHIDQLLNGAVEGISAGIVMDVDGHPNAIGIADFFWGESDVATSYDGSNGIYQVEAGGLVRIGFYDHILAELPPSPETEIRTGIRGDERGDFPVLKLSPPFRWATDDELPLSMEVSYENFVVRRGCGALAVACNETRAVQVIPIDTQAVPIEAWAEFDVFIESRAPRPTSDANYLDPGPLAERKAADVMWTGEEMIVWGGKTMLEGGPTLVDGAAFDPKSDTWRLLAPFPLSGPKATRAVWGEGEMLVVNSESVFAYRPESDTWRVVAEGVAVSNDQALVNFFEGRLYLWIGSHELRVLDVGSGSWEVLPAPTPNAAHAGQHFGVLRSAGDDLVAVVVPGSRCFGKAYLQQVDGGWEPLPDVDLAADGYADCSTANQSASVADGLMVWEEEGHPSTLYSFATGEWRTLPSIPLGGTEGPSGPVPMDDTHFMVPRWGEGAIFDADSETWTFVDFPGSGTDAEIIWTGKEFLAWTGTDAWRWTPPEGLVP